MITRDEYKIVSEYLVSQLDFDRLYDDTLPYSKKLFGRETIIDSIKKLILAYPDCFDTSCLPNRCETNTTTLRVHKGMLNDYIYLFSNPKRYTNNGWFMTEDVLMKEAVEYHKNNNDYFIIFNYKQYLRNIKIKKICQNITQTTSSIQE